MNISIFLIDEQGNNVDGWVQVNELFDSTSDGVGSFTIPMGSYDIRGVAFGYRVENMTIEVTNEVQEFTLLAKRG